MHSRTTSEGKRVFAWAMRHARDPATRSRVYPGAVVALGMAISGAVLTKLASRLWFIGDDWDFLLTRGTVPGQNRGLFAPHYDHWSSAVIVIYRALFAIFGLREYLPYALVVIVLHLAIVAVMYVLLVRFGTHRWLAAITAWMIAFLGAGSEALLWDTAMNLLGSILFGLLAILLCDGEAVVGRRRIMTWVLLIVSLTFSGAGISMVGMTAMFVAQRHSILRAVEITAIPALVWLVWFAAIGHTGDGPRVQDHVLLLQVPDYVWSGLSSAVGRMVGLPNGGAVLLIAILLAPALARHHPESLRHFAWAGVAAALGQMLLTGITRVGVGIEGSEKERYAYVTLVLLSPAIALGLAQLASALSGPRWLAIALGGVVMLGYTVNGVQLMHSFTTKREPYTRIWPDRLIGITEAIDDGETVLTQQPDTVINPSIEARFINSREIRAALPRKLASAAGRLDAESLSMVGVGQKDYGQQLPGVPIVLALGFEGRAASTSGCHDYNAPVGGTPALDVHSVDGAEIVVFSQSSKISTQLVRGDVVSGQRNWTTTPDRYTHVATSARNAILRVTFNTTGRYVICAL